MDSIQFIGTIKSPIKDLHSAPLQESEGAPPATIRIDKEFLPAVSGLKPGDKIVILTWLHKADRNMLTTHPRNDRSLPLTGVFATRSPNRPNPIGLHVADILEIEKNGEIVVSGLEVLDGTPVVDIKIHLGR